MTGGARRGAVAVGLGALSAGLLFVTAMLGPSAVESPLP